MAGKPKASCPLFLSAQIFPQHQIIKSDFPSVFSDVMPLWFGLIPGGCTKGNAAIWSVILQLWLKHRNFHLGEDASLSRSLWTLAAHVHRRRCYWMKLAISIPADVKSFLSFSAPATLAVLLFTVVENFHLRNSNVHFLNPYKLYRMLFHFSMFISTCMKNKKNNVKSGVMNIFKAQTTKISKYKKQSWVIWGWLNNYTIISHLHWRQRHMYLTYDMICPQHHKLTLPGYVFHWLCISVWFVVATAPFYTMKEKRHCHHFVYKGIRFEVVCFDNVFKYKSFSIYRLDVW